MPQYDTEAWCLLSESSGDEKHSSSQCESASDVSEPDVSIRCSCYEPILSELERYRSKDESSKG